MQGATGVRFSWEAPASGIVFGAPASAGTAADEEQQAGLQSHASRRPVRVRRPGTATAAAAAPAADAAASQPVQPQQQPTPPAPTQDAAADFKFGTPGAGPGGSATKARRSRGRTPGTAPAPSPAFTTGSTASMAWSPYPASSAGTATAFNGGPSPVLPSSTTPTSGPSAAFADGRGSFAADVAEDLRQRLNLGADAGTRDAAAEGGGASTQPADAAGARSGSGLHFVFGAQVPSPQAARAVLRKKSASGSPAADVRSRSAASSASPTAAGSASASPRAAPQSADSSATTSAGPEAGAGSFVFGANSTSPAATRVHHRARQNSRSPQQKASGGAAAAAPEPLREQQQQQQQAAAGQPGFVRLGDFSKPAGSGSTSPCFAAAPAAAARRPPRRKAPHAAAHLHPGLKPAGGAKAPAAGQNQQQPGQQQYASAPPPPAAGSSGAGLNAQEQSAYNTCEMYRSQGNESFRDADYDAACEAYTKAVHALWPHPKLHPRLALLLSNRAAALLSLGKPLSALHDCQMGLTYDTSLMRCALRVATCHSRMGDFDEAFRYLGKLRDQAAGNTEHLKEISLKQADLEAQEQEMYDALRSLGHSLQAPARDPVTGLLRAATGGLSRASSTTSTAGAAAPSTSEAFWEALRKVDDIAPHVPHAELLMAAKADGLLRLGKHDKAREFCEQPVHQEEGEGHAESRKRTAWRLWVQAQCSWHEGDTGGKLKQQLQELAAVLEQAQGQGQAGASAGAAGGSAGSAFFPAAPAAGAGSSRQQQRRQEELRQLVGLPSSEAVKKLLDGLEAADALRLAGNAAIKAGKAAEAVQKYSEALAATTGLSPAIAAVLLSNRAAAHQHLKQRAQAVADCCRAVALNPQYAKAQSRLATLLSELGYYRDAAAALEAAIATTNIPAADKKDYQTRLAREQAAAKRASARSGGMLGSRAPPVDHYKMLGVEAATAAEDVRRSYKKLALQLHPDKAASTCRVAVQCCGCGSPIFEAVAAKERLSERATWLFKLLGEANEVLSDASKRRELDHALACARAGGASSNGFSSYYGDDSDGEDDAGYSYFASMFGQRGYGGAGTSGFGGGAYGAGSRRNYGTGTGSGFGTGAGSSGFGAGSSRYGAGTNRYYGWG